MNLDFPINKLVSNGTFEKVDIQQVRKLTESGLPIDLPEERAIAWLILLGVFPEIPTNFQKFIDEKVDEYSSFVKDYHLEHWENVKLKENCPKALMNVDNKEKMHLIHNDILRTLRQYRNLKIIPFPGETIDDIHVYPSEYLKYQVYMRRMERLLYIYDQLNPSQGYLQGFNELIQPFFISFAVCESFFPQLIQVEALTFFSFIALISNRHLFAFFVLDEEQSLMNQLKGFLIVLERVSPKIYKRFEELKLNPLCYCYRWISLLFTQEIPIPDIFPIWDALISHLQELIQFAYYIAVAFVVDNEKEILDSSSSNILSILQKFSNASSKDLVCKALALWNKDIAEMPHSWLIKNLINPIVGSFNYIAKKIQT